MENRAPWLLRRSTGRTTRIAIASGVLLMLTCKSSAAACVGPYFVPLISTAFWSHPETSTDPLKVSSVSVAPGFSG